MNPDDPDRLVTQEEFIREIFGTSKHPHRNFFTKLRDQGKLPYLRVGKTLFYRLATAKKAFFAAVENAPAPNGGRRKEAPSAHQRELIGSN